MNKKLTKEKAIRLHRKMWKDMQTELGDNPEYDERIAFKKKWVREHFPNEHVKSNCFLCEYVMHKGLSYWGGCDACPIAWNSSVRPECNPGAWAVEYGNKVDYRYSPISVILALSER